MAPVGDFSVAGGDHYHCSTAGMPLDDLQLAELFNVTRSTVVYRAIQRACDASAGTPAPSAP